MPRMSAAEAGRKGGKSRSAKKLAACRRNGFQKPAPAEEANPKPAQEKPSLFTPILVGGNRGQ